MHRCGICRQSIASEELYSTDSNEDIFKPDTLFESFHRQGQTPISNKALLEGFLMLWLKKCVVPTLPHKAIMIDVVYPAVLLAHGRPLGHFPAMVGCIQNGLRLLTTQFCNVETEVNEFVEDVLDRNGEPKKTIPKPRVELPYTYLVAWFVMHCPTLMSTIPAIGESVPFIQRLEDSVWIGQYSAVIRRTLQNNTNYHFFRCFPEFPGAAFGERYSDDANVDRFTYLSAGVFW